jgi:hypothetical protein
VFGHLALVFRLLTSTKLLVITNCKDSAKYPEGDEDVHGGFVIAREEAKNALSVMPGDESNDAEANHSSESVGEDEPTLRILHDAGSREEGNNRNWRRQDGADEYGPESPLVEDAISLFGTLLADLFFQLLLATFLGDSVRDEPADRGADSGADCVVPPAFGPGGYVDDQKSVHAAGKGNDGLVEQADDDECEDSQPVCQVGDRGREKEDQGHTGTSAGLEAAAVRDVASGRENKQFALEDGMGGRIRVDGPGPVKLGYCSTSRFSFNIILEPDSTTTTFFRVL